MSDNPLPVIYKENYHTKKKKPLKARTVRHRLIKAMLNKYFADGGYKSAAFIPFVERWQLILAINLLCFIINKENPSHAWKQVLKIGYSLCAGHKGQAKSVKRVGTVGGEIVSELVGAYDGVVCPECNHVIAIEPHWHSIHNVCNVDNSIDNEAK